jgi:predicted metalloprotease
MRDTWPSMPLPEVRYVADGRSGPTGCTDSEGLPARYTGDSYEYCPPDMTVYLGQSTLWMFYRRTGDAGPAMGIAHEFAHHVQYQLDVPPPFTNEQSIEFENQADCIAGAWTRYADQHGGLETEDDLEDIEKLLPLIASAESEGEDRDHGTLEEREEAFTDGFLRGIRACGVSEG